MPIGFWILLFGMVMALAGWVAKTDYMQYKADQMREAQARKRRQAYIHSEEFIKSINRNNTFNSWVAEANGHR
jgi:hypothetical protein